MKKLYMDPFTLTLTNAWLHECMNKKNGVKRPNGCWDTHNTPFLVNNLHRGAKKRSSKTFQNEYPSIYDYYSLGIMCTGAVLGKWFMSWGNDVFETMVANGLQWLMVAHGEYIKCQTWPEFQGLLPTQAHRVIHFNPKLAWLLVAP